MEIHVDREELSLHYQFMSVPYGDVKLFPGLFRKRAQLNRKYIMSLDSRDLLQNFYIEANMFEPNDVAPGHGHYWEPGHLGWESPTCPLRGHFLGHWLSAAARLCAATSDAEVKGKAEWIVAELARCQVRNGGEWAGSIPEKYLHWIAEGQQVWAPQYTLHKTLMGLYDMYAYAGSKRALSIIENWSKWFHRWTGELSKDQLAQVLEVETGGMMEVWADVYSATKKPEYLELMNRYARHSLFGALLRGDDVLTNMHANTTIPEIHGAARAYEVTGEQTWRDIVEAFWRLAVTDRGTFCTGGQTSGEVWTPPGEMSARLGERNQEHCTVYNMIRLADYLFRWTGDSQYLDYIERNLYNGFMAQQHPQTGMISYFLPLHGGATKKWGSPTKHFWCCHGSLVQAHTISANLMYYQHQDAIVVAQYIPSEFTWRHNSGLIVIQQTNDPQTNMGLRDRNRDSTRRPNRIAVNLRISCSSSSEFTIRLRIPDWIHGRPEIHIDGRKISLEHDENGFLSLTRVWNDGEVLHVAFCKRLTVSSLPDRPDMVAFLDGPIVLAGLCGDERTLFGDRENPETLLVPDNEREWGEWKQNYRTVNQQQGIRFVPLYEIDDQAYTVYFPIKSN